ncbi:hypothetical protein TIFTF001_030782 [Ficus carica]|uniref:Uncharacterized protein n=1 Tax=Ficus carica TaxID=3494 RepID=A0AA88DU92_FICCA|nr:hypothetical protein TIFTF001_030782 [Ficus carica]
MSPHHPNGRARDIRLVEVKYPYNQSMPTSRVHSEYDPSVSPENPNSWDTLINRGEPHSLKYGLIFLAKTMSLRLLISAPY